MKYSKEKNIILHHNYRIGLEYNYFWWKIWVHLIPNILHIHMFGLLIKKKHVIY